MGEVLCTAVKEHATSIISNPVCKTLLQYRILGLKERSHLKTDAKSSVFSRSHKLLLGPDIFK